MLDCAGDKLKHEGECDSPKPTIPDYCKRVRCGTMYEPVCGKRHLTYTNKCIMECVKGDRLKHKGECKPKSPCAVTRIYRPVCGVNGKTYSNKTALACDRMDLWKEGKCEEE